MQVLLSGADRAAVTVDAARGRVHAVFEKTLESDFTLRNSRRVELPTFKPRQETQALTKTGVKRLWDTTQGRGCILWSLLLLTAIRPGERSRLE